MRENSNNAPPKSVAVKKNWHRLRRLLDQFVWVRFQRVSGFTKVATLLFFASICLLWMGYRFGSRHGLLAGFVAALAVNLIVFLYTTRLLNLFAGKELLGRDPWGIIRETEALCRLLGIKSPKMIVVSTSTPLIYSCGLFYGQYRVLLSTGLLELFSGDERKALLAFELNKLKYHYTSSTTAATALASCFQAVGQILDCTIFSPVFFLTRNKAYQGRREPIRLGLALMAPLIGLVNRLAVSKERLLELDRKTTETLTQSQSLDSARMNLAQALFKLESYAQTRPVHVRLCDSPLFAVNPLAEFDVSSYFLVHPKLEFRLLQLIGRKTIY